MKPFMARHHFEVTKVEYLVDFDKTVLYLRFKSRPNAKKFTEDSVEVKGKVFSKAPTEFEAYNLAKELLKKRDEVNNEINM